MSSTRPISILLFVVAGVTIPGVLNFLLTKAGMSQIGTLAWVAGYGTIILLAWAIWIRPIDWDPEGST